LLARSRDDPAAFAELVARHGPMVWGVCRHLLGEADAEDAFQATFVALLRSTVRDGAALAAWLHGAAVRVSLAARREAGRRRVRERVAAAPEAVRPREPEDWADTMAVVHREVARLPGADRSAFVLCVLEGLTQAEAAARLGRTPGAVAGQVARAKKRLAARLTGRGVVPGLAALGTASVAGAVPPGVAERASGLPGAVVPPAVLRLARGALGMTRPDAKMILAAAAVTAGLAVGVLAASGGPTPDPPPAAGVRPPDPADGPPAKVPDRDPSRPVRSLRGHVNRLTSVAYSPDGTSIATASLDGTVRLWNAATGEEVRRLGLDNGARPQSGEFSSSEFDQVAFSPDNGFLVTVKRESTVPPPPPPLPPQPPDKSVVIVWDPRTGEKKRTFPADGGSFAISPDGKWIACGGDQVIDLYELATGKRVRELHGGELQLEIVSLTFSPDGQTLISTGRPPTPQPDPGRVRTTILPDAMRLWDVATGKDRPSALNGVVVGRRGRPRIAFSRDGRTVINASGHDVSLREVATGGERTRFTGHKADLLAFALSPDGRTLASGSMDGTVRLWDLLSGKGVGRLGQEVEPVKGGWVLAVAFSPDGRTLVSGGFDKTADIWDVSRITGRPRTSAERSPADLEADWKDLAGDAAAGYAALGRLVSSPTSTVPFLGKRLEAASAVDAKPIERLIAALDDGDFRVRDQAAKDLEAMGDRAAPSLRKAIAITPSAEARQRLGRLLARVGGGSPPAETVRGVRAVEALEAIGSPEARRLLDKLAAGPSGMRLTEEAEASAGRLARRSPSTP
jgi:RNA polymerase sigma factor (sigma-70 family)